MRDDGMKRKGGGRKRPGDGGRDGGKNEEKPSLMFYFSLLLRSVERTRFWVLHASLADEGDYSP